MGIVVATEGEVFLESGEDVTVDVEVVAVEVVVVAVEVVAVEHAGDSLIVALVMDSVRV